MEARSLDNFTIIYKILAALEKAMDCPEFDVELISAQSLKVSEERWTRYMEMLADCGYIKGVTFVNSIAGTRIDFDDIRITLKGLEYLSENSFMKRAYRAVKGINEIFPSDSL